MLSVNKEVGGTQPLVEMHVEGEMECIEQVVKMEYTQLVVEVSD